MSEAAKFIQEILIDHELVAIHQGNWLKNVNHVINDKEDKHELKELYLKSFLGQYIQLAEGLVSSDLAKDSSPQYIKKLEEFKDRVWKSGELSGFTCNRCPIRIECEWAWDCYNTYPDCLAEK